MIITVLLIKKIISLFLIMLAGVVLVKTKLLHAEDSHVLSVLSIYLIMPCVILSAFQVDLTPDVRNGLLLAFCAAVVVHGLFIVLAWAGEKFLCLDAVERTSVVYSNAGSLIVPLVVAVLGKEWVIYSSAYVSVQLIFLWSHGKATLCGEKRFDVRAMLRNVNMIAIGLGVVLLITGIRFPVPAQDAMDSVGSMLGPAAMLATGMLIGNWNISQVLLRRRLWLIAALRLIICPLAVLLLIKFTGAAELVKDGTQILLISLFAVMTPSASSITQMAQVYGKDANHAGAINLITTLLCIVTMPCIVMAYQKILGGI